MFKYLRRFRRHRVHKISMAVALLSWPLTPWPWKPFSSAHSGDEYLCQVSLQIPPLSEEVSRHAENMLTDHPKAQCSPPTRSSAISDTPLKTRFFWLHFARRKYRFIFNHFYVMGPKSYRVLRNNANYTAITPFKVIQKVTDFGTNRKPICNFLLVINTNLTVILHYFQVMAD